MKIGLLSDPHAGYSRGTKEIDNVNVREQDVLNALSLGIHNLSSAGVDVILSLGDDFHVPHPRKRALLHTIQLINEINIPYYAVMGNHTLTRTRSDINVYDVLEAMCPRFHGYVEPTLTDFSAYLIPYGTEAEALQNVPSDAKFIAGHFAAEGVPWPGEHTPLSAFPKDIHVFLGHYHTRQINLKIVDKKTMANTGWDGPVYIGATERFAWGEARNPTGVAIYEDYGSLTFIEHETREWVDVTSVGDQILTDLRGIDLEGKIVRVNVDATPSEYHGLDIKAVRDVARGSLEFQIRRMGSTEAFTPDTQDTMTYSLLDQWSKHTQTLKPAEMRKKVHELGSKALASAGVGE